MGDIDLRPREYILKNELSFSRLIVVASLVIFVFFLLIAGLYIDLFIQEEILKSQELMEEYQRFEQLTLKGHDDQVNMQTLIERKEQLEMNIEVGKKWHPYLEFIFSAGGSRIVIQEFQMDKDGTVAFTARSEDLRELIRFLSELRKSHRINIYAYEQVGQMVEGGYHFDFEGKFIWNGSEGSVGKKGEAY